MADLIDRDALLKSMGLTDAVKYGNKDAEQQHRSYSTWMSYEIADAIQDAPAANRWIPCSEKKPERDQRVLVKFKYSRVTVWKEHTAISTAKYNGGDWWFIDLIGTDDEVDAQVIAWMPMPEPPEKE